MKTQKVSKKDKFLLNTPPPRPKSNFWKKLPVDIWLLWKQPKNTHDMSYWIILDESQNLVALSELNLMS